MNRHSIAIVGLGKIARDQHLPCIAESSSFELVAVASPHHTLDGIASFPDLPTLLRELPTVSSVALCTTPQVRFDLARMALAHGCHVLLEKPPGMTVSEVQTLVELARTRGVALHASWHSRHASAVEPARAWLAERRVRAVNVLWREDVRIWHPGQTWIWQPGGLGVFDPGINALSILTRILPGQLFLKDAQLSYPGNCATPIAAKLEFTNAAGAPVHAEFNFLHIGAASWDIDVDTDRGQLRLQHGASEMLVDGRPVAVAAGREYARLYVHFAELVRTCRVDVDLAPLQLVADAFLCGRRHEAADFFP